MQKIQWNGYLRGIKILIQKCVFDLSNNGIINGLINLPSCTKYTYLVYADKRHEENIINQLKN